MNIEEHFVRDIKDHKLSIHHDDGVYRHITMKRPNSNTMAYSLTTFPGHLVYSGDMGCFVFERLFDMFEFFRLEPNREPDMQYWHGKLQASDKSDGSEKPSLNRFKDNLMSYFEESELSEEQREEVQDFINSVTRTFDDEGPQVAYKEVLEFTLSNGAEYFIDFWDRDDKEFTFRYQWACYAIPHAIQRYHEAKQANPAPAPDPFPVPVPEKDMSSPSGWLNPAGVYYACEPTDHNALIEAIFGNTNDAWVRAEKLGWVHVSTTNVRGCSPATPRQLDKLADWCDIHGKCLRRLIKQGRIIVDVGGETVLLCWLEL